MYEDATQKEIEELMVDVRGEYFLVKSYNVKQLL